MATITPQGVVVRDLAGHRARLEDRARESFGANIALDPETPLGQIIGIAALALTEADESIGAMANGVSVGTAIGRQMDDLGTLLGIGRAGAVRSSVTLSLAGAPGTVIPAGSRVRTQAGIAFETSRGATLSSTGSATVAALATEDGPIEAPAGTVDSIVTLVAGWETVTNPEPAVPGRFETPDSLYRSEYRERTARLAIAPLDALRSGLSEAGVTQMRVEENPTDAAVTRQGLTIDAHSIMCICRDGEATQIAAAILLHKGLGVGMSGAVSQDGARFQRVTEVSLAITIATTVAPTFPANGIAEIRRNLMDYALGQWGTNAGRFETDGFEIGQLIDLNRLYSPIHSVPGHRVTALTVTLANGDPVPSTIQLNEIYQLDESAITITIS